jgi:hypothetical protein
MERRTALLGLLAASVAAVAFAACSSSSADAPTGTPGSDSGTGSDTGSVSVTDSGSEPDTASASDTGTDAGRDLSTDPGKFGGPTRCAQAHVQLCEDFESGTLDTATWAVTGNAPVIDGVQTMRGTKALHITKTGNGGSYIKEKKTFPAPSNTYYGRAFVYFDKLPAAPLAYAHWTFIAASGTGVSGEIRVSGQFQNGANHFGVGTDNRVDDAGTGDWTTTDGDPKPPNAVPTQKWLCIEWMHKGDTNETRFWWDAAPHPSLHTTPTVSGSTTGKPFILPQFTNVWLGWDEYQATTEPFEMWLDEIAIDPARIGCVL